MKSTFLRELGGRKFRILFNIRKDDEWHLQEGARFASQEKFEDVESVGFVLLELLKNPITDRSSQENGELFLMTNLAEWMVDPTSGRSRNGAANTMQCGKATKRSCSCKR